MFALRDRELTLGLGAAVALEGVGSLLGAALIAALGRAYGFAPIRGILLPEPADGWRSPDACFAGLAIDSLLVGGAIDAAKGAPDPDPDPDGPTSSPSGIEAGSRCCTSG